MSKFVNDTIESLKNIIEDAISDEKLSPQDIIDICNALVKHLEDERIGVEDFLEENKPQN